MRGESGDHRMGRKELPRRPLESTNDEPPLLPEKPVRSAGATRNESRASEPPDNTCYQTTTTTQTTQRACSKYVCLFGSSGLHTTTYVHSMCGRKQSGNCPGKRGAFSSFCLPNRQNQFNRPHHKGSNRRRQHINTGCVATARQVLRSNRVSSTSDRQGGWTAGGPPCCARLVLLARGAPAAAAKAAAAATAAGGAAAAALALLGLVHAQGAALLFSWWVVLGYWFWLVEWFGSVWGIRQI